MTDYSDDNSECEEPRLRFPVNCPLCAHSALSELPLSMIAYALITGSSIQLHAKCHDVYWDASQIEVEQIREYLVPRYSLAFTKKFNRSMRFDTLDDTSIRTNCRARPDFHSRNFDER